MVIQLKCGGENDNDFTGNFFFNLKAKKIKLANTWKSCDQKISLVFFDSKCTLDLN